MSKFVSMKEAQRKLNISDRVVKDIVEYAFNQQNLFRVLKVNDKYLIDRKTFSKWILLTQER